MRSPLITKYAFRIRTRIGLVVNNLMIHGRDEAEARGKLRQIYRDCEILDCVCHRGSIRTPVATTGAHYEQVISSLSRREP